MRSYDYMVALASPQKALLWRIMVEGVVLQFIGLAVPLFALAIFDGVIVRYGHAALHLAGVAMVFVALLECLLIYVQARRIHRLTAFIDRMLTRPVIGKWLELPLKFFESRGSGEISHHLSELQEIRQFLSAVSVTAVLDLVFIALVLAIMAVYSPLLTCIVALAVPFLVGVSAWMRPQLHYRGQAVAEQRRRFESLIGEGLHSIATIKAMAWESEWLRRWIDSHGTMVATGEEAKKSGATEQAASTLIQRLVILVVLWAGAAQVYAKALTFGELIACYLFAYRVLSPCSRVFQLVIGFFRIDQARRRTDQLLSQPGEAQIHRGTRAYVPGALEFDAVSFRYRDDAPAVLEEASFRLPQRSAAAVVGPTGAGKSTVSKLLQRHCVAQSGRIMVGGVPIDEIEIESWRRHVLLLTHDAALFHGTIRDNIAGPAGGDDANVRRCAELACATEFIDKLSQGLDTPTEEGALQLSSGQRQRIAMARAIHAKPQVLIVDEATNALDHDTEREVIRALRAEFADRILVLVTHRPHMLDEFDLVIRLDNGRLQVERVRHAGRSELACVEESAP